MSIFTTKTFMLLDSPVGGVENLADMKAAGFDGVFVNVHSHEAAEWTTVRHRAIQNEMFCGPWGRPEKSDHSFDPAIVQKVITVADQWNQPGVLNPENEVKDNQAALIYMAEQVGARDFAYSVQPIPFANLDWWILKKPVLLQIFPTEQVTIFPDPTNKQSIMQIAAQCKELWHAYGIECVVYTFGTYGGMHAGLFELQSPYSLFTGDSIQGGPTGYINWKPTSTGFIACKTNGEEPKMAGVATSLSDAWERINASNPARNWRQGSPGEWNKIDTYYKADDGSIPPTGIVSEFGNGLLALAEAKHFTLGTH